MKSAEINIRPARRADLPAIVRMLADDHLGAQREQYTDPLPEEYFHAFEAIDRDPNQELIVVEAANGEVIGTVQLTSCPASAIAGPGAPRSKVYASTPVTAPGAWVGR